MAEPLLQVALPEARHLFDRGLHTCTRSASHALPPSLPLSLTHSLSHNQTRAALCMTEPLLQVAPPASLSLSFSLSLARALSLALSPPTPYIYIYIYIYLQSVRERERVGEREGERVTRSGCRCISLYQTGGEPRGVD